MKISNKAKGDLGVCAGVVIPAGGSLDVDPDTLELAKTSAVVQGWFDDGLLVGDEQPKKRRSKAKSEQ